MKKVVIGTRKKALLVVGRLQPVPALMFAKAMWPRSTVDDDTKRVAAGMLLGKLQLEGYLSSSDKGYMFTNEGFRQWDALHPG